MINRHHPGPGSSRHHSTFDDSHRSSSPSRVCLYGGGREPSRMASDGGFEYVNLCFLSATVVSMKNPSISLRASRYSYTESDQCFRSVRVNMSRTLSRRTCLIRFCPSWSFNCPSRDPASPCLGLSALADTINCRILTEPLLQLPTTPLQGSQKKKSRPARTKSPKTVNGRVAPVQTPLPFTCSAVATNTKQANCPVELVPWRAGEQPVYH